MVVKVTLSIATPIELLETNEFINENNLLPVFADEAANFALVTASTGTLRQLESHNLPILAKKLINYNSPFTLIKQCKRQRKQRRAEQSEQ
jgi:hypothetical protein